MSERSLQIRLTGKQAVAPKLPPLLAATTRSADPLADRFLPPGLLLPTGTYDLTPAARGSAAGATSHTQVVQPDELIVLELADGGTLITSAERLRQSLQRTRPDLIGDDGSILLEKMRVEGAAPSRGLSEALGGLISRVYTFVVVDKADAILDAARHALGGKSATLGISWLGTKALMAAIESRLDQAPGLYRWIGASGKASDLQAVDLAQAASGQPMLVFVHGTASSTIGSFGDLQGVDHEVWHELESRFTGGICAFEHRTLSESPIENAIALASSLPVGARVSLVSHSRGGLVTDLLCLGDFDALIGDYGYRFAGTGDAAPEEAARVMSELEAAHAAQREQLRWLARVLRERGLVVERYVRVASPAAGTLLASGNFDVFLSGLLTLIGAVPFFIGSPIYSAFKRAVIEIARNRTNPHVVPGIEAMLPDSPMARLLREAPVRPGISMAVIAGDIEGGNLMKRLGVLLTDFLLFDNTDNDLVVNTTSMLAGIASKADARVLFDRGVDVSHFRYFGNADTRSALRDWLLAPDPSYLEAFRALPRPADFDAAMKAAGASRSVEAPDRPVVVILPGFMSSHLRAGRQDRVWLDPLDIAAGGLARIQWGHRSVEAEELLAMFYGKLCQHLTDSHRVEPFAYDWREPLDVLAERLGEFLDRLMKQTQQPIRLLAHGMGGLVVRACIHKRRPVLDELMSRDGARLMMLGTPNQGTHSMVENMIGKGEMLRTLERIDLKHDMQQVLDIFAGFRGALQLLPKPGFMDTFQGQSDGGQVLPYQQTATWVDLKSKVTDLWIGNHRCATPSQQVLDESSWLWRADGLSRPSLPLQYESKSVYVFGIAPSTPCGVREERSGSSPRLRMVGTSRGDGVVTWASGLIGGISRLYYMPVTHGDLLSSEEHFGAITDLLVVGDTERLATTPPSSRAIDQPIPVLYDAGPPIAADTDAALRALTGGSQRNRVPPRSRRRLEVAVKAMDLRFVSQPIMVGHYEQDAISGAESLIDRELLGGDLRERQSLGIYAGARGSATVVLRAVNGQTRSLSALRGAVVTGLGSYDRPLTPTDLAEAARNGALRYLLHVIDVLGKADREVSLATLLLGYNSSVNLTVSASVEALVRGVMDANAKFYDSTGLNVRIARLDIVEIYLDTAISAAYALREIGFRLKGKAARQGFHLVCKNELIEGEGTRQRLFDERGATYWPRLIVSDADRGDDVDGPVDGPVRVADRLRYLYVGQRARAESVVLQRQPGLIEQLIAKQVSNPIWDPDFGRMLFQLMIPYDFKDTTRRLDRVVFVVDRYTANLPWELMLAGDVEDTADDQRPLALRTAMVRQLVSTHFRQVVRQGIGRRALVIGNTSVGGFVEAFPFVDGSASRQPASLPGAESEALSVSGVLGKLGYKVSLLAGETQTAGDVLSKLYEQSWRVLHISGHGVFNLMHADGRARTGVLLSGGMLITAAEVAAMETVPELVFLNCCHLGQVDVGAGRNKLAASVAGELIEVGVRCVLVAGWAVDDISASLFGLAFYEQLLLRRRTFGDAVFEARLAVWQAYPSDITWGAFQAYGEPGWQAEPGFSDPRGPRSSEPFASPQELQDELARLRAVMASRAEHSSPDFATAFAQDFIAMLRRCPHSWLSLPQVQSAVGNIWFDLHELERARDALLAAVQAVDTVGQVPISDIEKLANIEARLGERRAEAELASRAPPKSEALIDLALQRLDGLDALLMAGTVLGGGPASSAPRRDAERCALRGSAWRRKASLRAHMLLASIHKKAELESVSNEMHEFIARGIEAYRAGEGSPGARDFSIHHVLNRLALSALRPWPDAHARLQALDLVRQCGTTGPRENADSPIAWDAVNQVNALLIERLIDGSLSQAGDEGDKVFAGLVQAYGEVLGNTAMKPAQLDSMGAQMAMLSRLADAISLLARDDGSMWRTGSRLLALAQHLQPSLHRRSDRPPAPQVKSVPRRRGTAARPVAAPTPRKTASRKR